MTTPAAYPKPAPDLSPVPVHITGAEPGTIGGAPARPHKLTRTDFGSETVDDTNKVRPLLPESSRRRSAHVQATGGDVWLCDGEAKAKGGTPEGSVLPAANTAPWPIRGHNAVWIVQKTGATTCVVSFTADYQED